ncbi:MAG TPA: FUSC family protein, partial [Hyphomicrobiaceae bacterium]|nr:FUSC family protein [Hyphomicrobiaceae bacterium]
MISIAKAGRSLRSWLVDHGVQWRLAVRVTTSAVVTLAASQLLNLRIPLWAVLTAVILTQLSVGRSLRATTDYFIGTVGAAVYAGSVGALFWQGDAASLYGGLAVAVAPTTLLAALNPRFSAAPFTAVLVFLAPMITHASPIESALERLWEVAVGGSIGLLVSLLVLPARAHGLALEAAADMLRLMARLQPSLFKKLTQHP